MTPIRDSPTFGSNPSDWILQSLCLQIIQNKIGYIKNIIHIDEQWTWLCYEYIFAKII